MSAAQRAPAARMQARSAAIRGTLRESPDSAALHPGYGFDPLSPRERGRGEGSGPRQGSSRARAEPTGASEPSSGVSRPLSRHASRVDLSHKRRGEGRACTRAETA